MKKKKLRNTRPKALFGEVAAAGITAAATLAAAGIGAAATAKAAKEQSDATIENARQQAASIEATNTNNNQLQQQSQQFIAQENEANRQIQRDLQMNLQLQGGQLDMEQRRAASRIQVKKGGRVKSRKKLRDAQFPLRGSYTDITTSDGGVNVPIGYSPEGYPMYRVTGDKHNEKHKVDGKLLGGVGENVPGVDNFEAEDGELLLDRRMSSHGDIAIASNLKHGDIYPARLIEAGAPVDPIIAEQERVNNKRKTSPVKGNRYKALAGVSTNYILPTDYSMSNLGFDMSGINVAAARRSLKKGGRCKAANGLNFIGPRPVGYYTPRQYNALDKWYGYGLTPTLNSNSNGVTPQVSAYEINNGGSKSNKSFYDRLRGISGNLWGAGIGALGNLGGAWLTSWGANRASKYLSKAYTDAGNILADAYDNLTGVDISSLNRDMFRNQHYMPVVRSSNFNVNPQIEDTKREFNRLMRATNAGTLSSAARLSRLGLGTAAMHDQLSKIYADKYNKEEAIKQQNNQTTNEAAAKNAELDVQSSRDFTKHYVDLLKYNADIANERITGRAQALSDALMGSATTIANARQAIGQSWGNAVDKTAQGFGNALITDAAQNLELDIARMSATREGELSYLKRLGTPEERDAEINSLYSILQNPNSTQEQKANAQRELIYLSSNFVENTRAYNRLRHQLGLSSRLRSYFNKQ